MNIESLAGMANQIGDFFDAMPDRAEALEGLTQHIRRFWALRMREQLSAYFDEGGATLSPIVREALAAHSIVPTPVPTTANPAGHAWEGDTES